VLTTKESIGWSFHVVFMEHARYHFVLRSLHQIPKVSSAVSFLHDTRDNLPPEWLIRAW